MNDPNSNSNNNNNQELMQLKPEELQDSGEPPFALLRLNNHQLCTSCGCSGSNPILKRRSPSSSSSFQDPLHPDPSHSEPNPKRLFFEPDDLTLRGFSKVSLGPSPPAQPHSPLRRCVSDPAPATAFVAPPMAPFADASVFQVQNPNPNAPDHSPEHARTGVIPVTPPSNTRLPPLPPSLCRSVSDPSPSPAKAYSRSSSSGDVSVGLAKKQTPDSKKRLRRMKACMREISKWCREVAREPGEEDAEEKDANAAMKDESRPEIEESVFVEKVGEALTVHFKCPCGKGYQILLAGRDCFYKLM